MRLPGSWPRRALAAAFVVYIIINYGVRGSFQMVYRMNAGERR